MKEGIIMKDVVYFFMNSRNYNQRKKVFNAEANLASLGCNVAKIDVSVEGIAEEELLNFLKLNESKNPLEELILKSHHGLFEEYADLPQSQLISHLCENPEKINLPISMDHKNAVASGDLEKLRVFRPRQLRLADFEYKLNLARSFEEVRYAHQE